jgi:CDGSH-type Zn-finger protein/uncharacterized Fe-S cluster protein YjdI
MKEDIHEYEGEDITVSYDVMRCIHVRECVRGLPHVFDPNKRPWIEPDNATADELAEVITRCPTGALHFERTDDGPAEQTPTENTVLVAADGPLYLRGDVDIAAPDGTVILEDTRVALCRCGLSANKPLCDNSHRRGEDAFRAPGTVGDARAETDETENDEGESGGPLTVTPTPDGPVLLEGNFRLMGAEDGSAVRGTDAALCRCGGSQNKPFCDGTHAKIGFSTEDER